MDEADERLLHNLNPTHFRGCEWGLGVYRVEDCAAAGRRIVGLLAENQRLAAKVKRMMPKAMTDDEACASLNEIAYSGGRDWKPDEYGHGYIQSEWLKEGMGSWTAHAIAAQLLREKEAAK